MVQADVAVGVTMNQTYIVAVDGESIYISCRPKYKVQLAALYFAEHLQPPQVTAATTPITVQSRSIDAVHLLGLHCWHDTAHPGNRKGKVASIKHCIRFTLILVIIWSVHLCKLRLLEHRHVLNAHRPTPHITTYYRRNRSF